MHAEGDGVRSAYLRTPWWGVPGSDVHVRTYDLGTPCPCIPAPLGPCCPTAQDEDRLRHFKAGAVHLLPGPRVAA